MQTSSEKFSKTDQSILRVGRRLDQIRSKRKLIQNKNVMIIIDIMKNIKK